MAWLRGLVVLFALVAAIGIVTPRLVAVALLNLDSMLWLKSASASVQNEQENGTLIEFRPFYSGNSGFLRLARQFDSDNMAVRRALRRDFLAAGKVEEALTLTNGSQDFQCAAVEKRPDCWLLRGAFLAKEGEKDTAIQAWRDGADLAAWKWPPDYVGPVLTSGAYMYRALLERHPDRADWRVLLMRLLWQIGRLDEARAHASVLLESERESPAKEHRAQALLVVAQAEETSGDSLAALETLNKALAENPRLALAYVRLYAIYNSLGRTEEAQAIARRLAVLTPQRTVPGRFRETTGGEQLLGYDITSGAVGEDPLLDLVLYWRLPENRVPEEAGWVRAGDHWLQFVRLPNLAINAGFEQDDWIGPGVPAGYVVPDWMYVSSSEQGLFPARRSENVSKVFRQLMGDNTASGSYPLAVELPPFRVRQGECFLFDAEIGGESGSGAATLWWRDENQAYVAHDNILGKTRDADPAVLCAPRAASWMHFVLSLSKGKVEWDNIMIARLPAPTP